MRVLVVMDPPEAIYPAGDTTLVLVREALLRGHEVSICQPADLELDGAEVVATTTRVVSAQLIRPPFELGKIERVPLSIYRVVLMRKDPPFDLDYYTTTLMLERARGQTLLVNDPAALRGWNEKLAILQFPELIPPTFVTRSLPRLRQLLDELGGQMIIKPLDGRGGDGVFLVRKDDRNTSVIFETSTALGRRAVVAQAYLPEARAGDKRILLLDGEPIGAVLRVPRGDDNRGNLHVGGTAQRTSLTPRDLEICATVGQRCREAGLYFVGLDVIGYRLTEVNVTSPTGVQEIDRLENHEGSARLPARVVDWLERRAA